MIARIETIKYPLKNMKGFTLIELIVVTVIISVLSSIAIVNYIPLRRTALDTTALADTRNFAESVVEAALADQDVDYTKGVDPVGDEGVIGDTDTLGNPRTTPVFSLSPGVAAIITGNSDNLITAIIYHTNGTAVDNIINPLNTSGRKEYICFINAATGLVSLP